MDSPQETGPTNEILAKKAGIGKSNMANLLAVYRNRPELFERVFNGDYSINKAYTEMKRDEMPEDMSVRELREIVGKAYTELGRELYEAQQELAKQGSKYEGVFEKWYTYLGWKKRTVYNLIDRFNLVQNLHEVSEIERIEDLPVSLSYEIAKPTAESTPEKAQAKAEVLVGEYRKHALDLS